MKLKYYFIYVFPITYYLWSWSKIYVTTYILKVKFSKLSPSIYDWPPNFFRWIACPHRFTYSYALKIWGQSNMLGANLQLKCPKKLSEKMDLWLLEKSYNF